jgi:hypothetical protein
MAKDTMKNMKQQSRKSTQATEKTEDKPPKNTPISVYLTKEEREYIEGVADRLGVSRHAILQFGVKYFISQHVAGEIRVPVETKTVTEIKAP